MGGSIIRQGLETAIATGSLEDGGDGKLLTSQLTVETVFHNLAVGLATDKDAIALWHIADALLVAIGLLTGDERVGTYLLDVACGVVDADGHQVETGSTGFVVDNGIAVVAQPRDATIVTSGHGLGEGVLLVEYGLLGSSLQREQTYQNGEESSFHRKNVFIGQRYEKNRKVKMEE